jgi:hypothetical protein
MIVETMFIIIAAIIIIWILLMMHTKSTGNDTDYEMIVKNGKEK